MRVLVTGAGGFVGPHLARALTAHGHEVVGLSDHAAPVASLVCDLRNGAAVENAVASVKPDAVVHLAGLSSVAECAKNPSLAFDVNTGGTFHLLRALQVHTPKARTVFVSSGEVYGAAAGTAAVDERVTPVPINVYGATKLAAEVFARQFAHAGLPVMIARAFNHIGAGQTPTFVLASFARQLASVAQGMKVVLEVGNLAAIRDFSHVDDVVEGYALLLERGIPGEIYNLASGESGSIEQMLRRLVKLSGREAEIKVDAARLRPIEIPVLSGRSEKMRALGWSPRRTLDQALQEIMQQAEQQHPHSG